MTGRSEEAIGDLLAAYALNALEPGERERVERAIEQEPRYAAVLEEMLADVSRLHVSHQPAIPSAALRERVLAVAESSRRGLPSWVGTATVPKAFWGLAASLVVAVVTMTTFAYDQYQRADNLEQEMQGLVAEAARAEEKLQQSAELAALVTDPAVAKNTMLPIAPPHEDDPAHGVLFQRPDGKWVLWVTNLDPLPDGMVYQAWLWVDESRVYSLAVFTPDDEGQALISLWMPLESPESGRSITVNASAMGGVVDPNDRKILWGGVQQPTTIDRTIIDANYFSP